MASIQKRGKTYQYTVSRMVNGKSKPIRKGGFRTKKDAKIAAAEIELQLGKGIVPYLKSVPIDGYFNKWVNLYKSHLSPVTKKHYEYTYNAIKAHFGNKPLQRINRHDYQKFLNEFGTNRSKETMEKINTHIRACVRDAVDEHIIHSDFTRNAVITWTRPAKKSFEKHLNYKESEILLKELWNKVDENLEYSLLLLALTSGMRYSEMVGLTWNDFNFTNNTIIINKTRGYMKRTSIGFGATKNEQSIRMIKMDNLTMNHFKSLFQSGTNNLQQLVFYYPKSKYKVIGNTQVNRLLKELLLVLGLNPITIHGLRHTHASVLLYRKVYSICKSTIRSQQYRNYIKKICTLS